MEKPISRSGLCNRFLLTCTIICQSYFGRCSCVVGHAIRNDLRCLEIKLGKDLDPGVIRDTQIHYKERYFCAVK